MLPVGSRTIVIQKEKCAKYSFYIWTNAALKVNQDLSQALRISNIKMANEEYPLPSVVVHLLTSEVKVRADSSEL